MCVRKFYTASLPKHPPPPLTPPPPTPPPPPPPPPPPQHLPGGSLLIRPVLEQYATSAQLYLPGNNVVSRHLVKEGMWGLDGDTSGGEEGVERMGTLVEGRKEWKGWEH